MLKSFMKRIADAFKRLANAFRRNGGGGRSFLISLKGNHAAHS